MEFTVGATLGFGFGYLLWFLPCDQHVGGYILEFALTQIINLAAYNKLFILQHCLKISCRKTNC